MVENRPNEVRMRMWAGNVNRDHIRARLVHAGANPNTDKICPRCEQAKPVSAFGAYGWKASFCAECRREYSRNRQPLKKLELRAWRARKAQLAALAALQPAQNNGGGEPEE